MFLVKEFPSKSNRSILAVIGGFNGFMISVSSLTSTITLLPSLIVGALRYDCCTLLNPLGLILKDSSPRIIGVKS